MNARACGLLLAGTLAIALVGCESSQDKSARLKRQGAHALALQRGLVITKRNTSVRIVKTGLVTDSNGTAAAITLRSAKPSPLGTTPIAFTILDPKGKSVFRNDAAGLQPSLVSIAAMPPGQDVTWVNDQVTPNGTAAKLRAELGAAISTAPPALPKIDVGQPHLLNDSTSGMEAVGKVTNDSKVTQLKLFVYLAAWRGGKLVAAGRGAINKLAAGAHTDYHIFLIGKPQGAQFSVSAPPTVFR